MRLLNVKTLAFEEYFEKDVPKYAILSHTWSGEEVSLQDFLGPRAKSLKGFAKIQRTCEEALRRGLGYAWVDTCCIDKTSSAELSEAINSMFRWYEEAAVCFAYLSDVEPGEDPYIPWSTFASSRWFTRGWTLQELLAPTSLIFFASDWTVIASRDSLARCITDITDIREVFLRDEPPKMTQMFSRSEYLFTASASERMNWAAKRETTRTEDRAYCLLGVFKVNMPLIYGEGSNAFMRLQEEILRRNFDPTLLAWSPHKDGHEVSLRKSDRQSPWQSAWGLLTGKSHPWRAQQPKVSDRFSLSGLLAPGPEHFADSGKIVPSRTVFDWSLTSKGLSMTLPTSDNLHPYIILPCRHLDRPWTLLALPLKRHTDGLLYRTMAPIMVVSHEKWWIWAQQQNTFATKSARGQPLYTRDRGLVLRSIPSNVSLTAIYSKFSFTVGPGVTDHLIMEQPMRMSREWEALMEMRMDDTQEQFGIVIDHRQNSVNYLRAVQYIFVGKSALYRQQARLYPTELPGRAPLPFGQLPDVKHLSVSLRLASCWLRVSLEHQYITDQAVVCVDIRKSSSLFASLRSSRLVQWSFFSALTCVLFSLVFVSESMRHMATDLESAAVRMTACSLPQDRILSFIYALSIIHRCVLLLFLDGHYSLLAYHSFPLLTCFAPRYTSYIRACRFLLTFIFGCCLLAIRLSLNFEMPKGSWQNVAYFVAFQWIMKIVIGTIANAGVDEKSSLPSRAPIFGHLLEVLSGIVIVVLRYFVEKLRVCL